MHRRARRGIIICVDGVNRAAAARPDTPEHGRAHRATHAAARALGLTQRPELPAADLTAVVRDLDAESNVPDTLERVVELASRAVPGCGHASVTLPGPVTAAASDGVARRLDGLQYGTDAGPSLDALVQTAPARSADLTVETRWPDFAAGAVRAGVRSVIACRLTLGGQAFGVLTLYAPAAGTFGPASVPFAAAYSAHAAGALARVAEREQIVQLRRAVGSNRVIGTAIALLMGTRLVSEAEAFDLLRSASRATDRSLREVAADVVARGGGLA
jgi:GAF domain-containing protein